MVFHDLEVQRNIRLYAPDEKLFESPRHPCNGLGSRFSMNNELGQKIIIVWRHVVAAIYVAVYPNPGSSGPNELGDTPRRGDEGPWVFGVNPALDAVTIEIDILLL